MSQLGELLRRRRETQGITLEELQTRTKIRIKYLEAIEAGDYAVIPGEVYLRGFIRSVAKELALDQQEVMQLYQQESEPAHEPVAPDAPSPSVKAPMAPIVEPEVAKPLASSSPRSTSLSRAHNKSAKMAPRLLWLLVMLGVVVAGVFFFWDRLGEQPIVEDPNLLPPDGNTEEPDPDPEPPQPQIELQNPGDANPIYVVHPGPLEIVLTAEGDACWVGLKADGNSQQTTLNPKGQTPSLTVQAENEIAVRVGNPAALRLTINGLDQGIIGGTRAIDLTVKLQPTP